MEAPTTIRLTHARIPIRFAPRLGQQKRTGPVHPAHQPRQRIIINPRRRLTLTTSHIPRPIILDRTLAIFWALTTVQNCLHRPARALDLERRPPRQRRRDPRLLPSPVVRPSIPRDPSRFLIRPSSAVPPGHHTQHTNRSTARALPRRLAPGIIIIIITTGGHQGHLAPTASR